jgi:hypothetical protein
MYVYHAFDRCLHSELPLPELQRRRTGRPDWVLRIGRGTPAPAHELLAEHTFDREVLHLWRTEAGIRLVYEPVGSFDIAASGRAITWFPSVAPIPEWVAAMVLGPVLSLALHAQGTVCLHGSAVRIGREGVAFIAPKRFGKSTLSAALVESGTELISDDTLAVEFTPSPVLLPGVHSLKLWRDSFEQLAPQLPKDVGSGVKPTLRGYPSAAKRTRPTPLAAAYLLRPVRADLDLSVERELISPREAVLSLVANAKVGALLEPPESALLLSTAAAIARSVPVFELTIPRDWNLLPEVVRMLGDWHAGAVALPTALTGPG